MYPNIIINADDYGFSPGTNKGIEEAFNHGILTSASIMPTGPSFREAVRFAKRHANLGIGVHLSLTLGRSVLPPNKIPDLVDRESYFHPDFFLLFLKCIFFHKRMKAYIENELDAQITAVKRAGLIIDHLDSQYHVHMIPLIFSVLRKLARKHKIPIVRVSKEPLFVFPFSLTLIKWAFLRLLTFYLHITHNLPKKYPIFYGMLHTRQLNKQALLRSLTHASTQHGMVEILSHPGYFQIQKVPFDYTRQKIVFFISDSGRIRELKALTDTEVKRYIKKNKLKLTTFRAAVDRE